MAKALDPDIYRNIEFDSWSTSRKESCFRNWCPDFEPPNGSSLHSRGFSMSAHFSAQVGVKCMVKLPEFDEKLFKCHIQEISANKGSCVVFIEDLAEKRSVASTALRPWRRLKPMNFDDSCKKLGHSSDKLRIRADDAAKSIESFKSAKNQRNDRGGLCNLDTYTDLANFQPPPVDVVAMPFTYYRSYNNNQRPQQSSASRAGNSATKQSPNDKQPIAASAQPPKATDEKANASQHGQSEARSPSVPRQDPLDVNAQLPPNPYPAASNYVYYYAPSEGIEQPGYNMSPEMMGPQTLYTVSPQVFPMPMGQPYGAMSPAQLGPLYPMPYTGWAAPPSSANMPGKPIATISAAM